MSLHCLPALSIAPAARDWLLWSSRLRWLYIFDHACDLINERGEVLSVVSSHIGDGPFNLVVEDCGINFSDLLNVRSQITIASDRIILGDIGIDMQKAILSSPRPDWEWLHSGKESILNQLILLPVTGSHPSIPSSLLSALFASVSTADTPSACTAARRLAGLGPGLTPAGDDILLGALLAAHLLHPSAVGTGFAEALANAAAPLTTSLSAAWLRAAGRGEAGILWHRLFVALISENSRAIQDSIEHIAVVGQTSGADALAGFLGSLTFYQHSHDIPEYLQ